MIRKQRWLLSLLLALAMAPSLAPSYAQDAIKSALSNKSAVTSNEDEYLPVDEAFKFSAAMHAPDAITLSWIIAPEYYLYQERFKISLDGESKIVQLGAMQFPP